MDSSAQLNLRRLRQSPLVRQLVREYRVTIEQMIQPLFVVENLSDRQAVPGLVGTYRETSESLLKTVENDLEKGVTKFLLFGVPSEKGVDQFPGDFTASQITGLRKRFGKDIFIAVDVCLCSSTLHGHCGVLSAEGDHVVNGSTVDALSKLALVYGESGADCVAPSDMMDGRVRAIRAKLDGANLDQVLVMSYSAKFHSKYYGPFRLAADSAPKGNPVLKDRATYQIDPSAPKDARACSLRDASEGADILMVKPGMPYLDVLKELSLEIQKPWAVYEVSGEYAAVELMAQHGLMKGPAAHVEAWTAMVRAGASMIISYGARYAKEYIQEAMYEY